MSANTSKRTKIDYGFGLQVDQLLTAAAPQPTYKQCDAPNKIHCKKEKGADCGNTSSIGSERFNLVHFALCLLPIWPHPAPFFLSKILQTMELFPRSVVPVHALLPPLRKRRAFYRPVGRKCSEIREQLGFAECIGGEMG
jgi:hypothetical protein